MNAPLVGIEPAPALDGATVLALEFADRVGHCGGKAVSLARMLRAGLPVPASIVLTVQACEELLRAARLQEWLTGIEQRAQTADAACLAAIESEVRAAITAAALPPELARALQRIAAELPQGSLLAVRSSAVGEDGERASCAGLMDSVLGVRGAVALERAVKQVWASRWSARALAYARAERTSLGGIAVIVQQQVDAAYAGVLFTCSPEPGRSGEMLCEYTEGLADRLVAGEVMPRSLHLPRDGAGKVPALPSAESPFLQAAIESLAAAAISAERLFGTPQDIEWALDRTGRVWVVQARPITTAAASGPARRTIVWTNANVNENFPDPITPLLYSIVAPGYSYYFANLAAAFGLSRRRRQRMASDLAAIVGVHAGRLYYNLTAIHAVLREAPFGDRLVAWFNDFTGAEHPAQGTGARGARFVATLRDVAELAWIAVKTAWQYGGIGRRIGRFEALADDYAADCTPARLQAAETLALRDRLRRFVEIRQRRWVDASFADAAAMVCYGALKTLVARAMRDEPGSHHNAMLQGLSDLKSAEPVAELWALAARVRRDPALTALSAETSGDELAERIAADQRFTAFKSAFESYLDRWGFRCSGELMLTVPGFDERPGDLLEIIRGHARELDAAPAARLAAQRSAREASTRNIIAAARRRSLVRFLPWPNVATVLEPVLAAAQAAIGLRERARTKQAMLYNALRRVALAIGARLVGRGRLRTPEDIFHLTAEEIDQLLSGVAMFVHDVPALVELRRAAHARFVAAAAPAEVLVAPEGEYPRVDAGGADAGHADGLRGVSVCGGIVRGRARVLTDVAQSATLRRGEILIARQTDPGWAPAFVTIAGLVLERGGMLSHGAILAREYGIPTLVGVPRVTERIADGAMIELDADAGEVRIVGTPVEHEPAHVTLALRSQTC